MKERENGMRLPEGWGCSAFSWETEDGKHLWGRNFDYNRIAMDSRILFIPRGSVFYTCGTKTEGNLQENTRQEGRYAAVGTGSRLLESTPVLYEGINEKGLMGGQLYYREFAHFPAKEETSGLPLAPPFAVTYFLTQCASVEEVARCLQSGSVILSETPVLGSVPPIHWIFADKTGESIVIEPDEEELHIYRNTMGVLTNSPGYPWHRQNLQNYAHIRDADYGALKMNGDRIPSCFSGSGALGLPGDWSSPSRFVRLSFLKKYAVKGSCEKEGAAYMFRLFQDVAFPLGLVRIAEEGNTTSYDRGIVPYDYTVYTALMCAESLRFYWTTYRDLEIRHVDLKEYLEQTEAREFPLEQP